MKRRKIWDIRTYFSRMEFFLCERAADLEDFFSETVLIFRVLVLETVRGVCLVYYGVRIIKRVRNVRTVKNQVTGGKNVVRRKWTSLSEAFSVVDQQ